MFNVIIENKPPINISEISGIPADWTRSSYNYKKTACDSMKELLKVSLKKSKYVLLSYNDEGIIKKDEWNEILKEYNVKKYEILYDTYKGSKLKKEEESNRNIISSKYIMNVILLVIAIVIAFFLIQNTSKFQIKTSLNGSKG